MERAIKNRDQHCVWPGCTHSNHLQIHHIKHCADGGATSVQNGACLCSYHHTFVHAGGFTIEHVEHNNHRLAEQFIEQQHTNDLSIFDFEIELRNDRESFNTVRKLSTTSYRFRVVAPQEKGFPDNSNADMGSTESRSAQHACDTTHHHSKNIESIHPDNSHQNNIRVECGQPILERYYAKRKGTYTQAFTSEEPPNYAVNTDMIYAMCH